MKYLLPLFLLAACSTTHSDMHATGAASGSHGAITVVPADQAKWTDHPAVKGAKMCVMHGNPDTGPSVVLLKFSAGTEVPAHWHSAGETVTVVRGNGLFGTGEIADRSRATKLGPGSYIDIPARAPHWAFAQEEFMISIAIDGPADFNLCGAH